MNAEWLNELETICVAGVQETGTRGAGLEAVARFVLADADCWRQRLGMDPIAPEVAGYHHHITEPRSPYALPTVQAVAGNLSYGSHPVYWGTDGHRHGSNHSVLEQQLANAGDRRDWDECDRLARASLSGAEGQE